MGPRADRRAMPHIVRSAVLVLAGVSAGVAQTDRYVVKGNPGAEPPYASWAQETTDLDGTPRIRQGFVDMGALECMGYDGTSVLLQ